MKIALAAVRRTYRLEIKPGALIPAERFDFAMTPSHVRMGLAPRPASSTRMYSGTDIDVTHHLA